MNSIRCIHVGDQLLRLFAEHINLFGLIQVLHEKFLVRVTIELLNQLFDCFSATCVLLLDCRYGAILGPSRIEFLPYLDRRPSGSLQ